MTEKSAQENMSAQANETGAASELTRELTQEPLRIGGLELNSRLIMGTGGATSMDTLEPVSYTHLTLPTILLV